MKSSLPPTAGPSPVEAVLLVELFHRRAGHQIAGSSRPGHLLQLTVEGDTKHEVSGRRYDISRGDFIWFHEDELVKASVLRGPWSFYSINFVAPALPPPPFEARVKRNRAAAAPLFADLLDVWRDRLAPLAVRDLRVQAALLRLLAELSLHETEPVRIDASTSLWWEIETSVRRNLSCAISMQQLEATTGRSEATIARSCQSAVGVSPMKRIRQIRMSLARGLVQRSGLAIQEIADRVGFSRLHEFSRAYRNYFGRSPSEDRQART